MSETKPRVVKTQKVKTQKVTDTNTPIEKAIYDSITSTQQAINMAVAENRVVRFKTDKTNAQIKAEIDFKKGCLLRKPDKNSKEVAIIPPGIEDFCFEKRVDESIEIKSKIVIPKVVIPKPIIYT